MRRLGKHIACVGLPNVDESTFRSFVLAALIEQCPTAKCQLEWHTYDMLTQIGGENALIEFKFYVFRRTRHLDESDGPWKGNAGVQNQRETRACIKKLSVRQYRPIHHKYLILAYENKLPAHSKLKNSFDEAYGVDGFFFKEEDVHRLIGPVESIQCEGKGLDRLTCEFIRIHQ